jgi:uncharacterized protein (TIGR03083 family)
MDPAALVHAVEREGLSLLEAGRSGVGQPVPACPGWAVADVLGHMGRVYRSISEIVERRAQEVPKVEIPKPPSGDAVLEFFASGHARVVAALSSISPEEPVYTWSNQRNAAFYQRRMAHETAVHRWDVQAAYGAPAPIDADLAADGVDEFYGTVLPFALRRVERERPTGSLHLHRTDGPGEWIVDVAGGEVVMRREHAKGDAAVRGGASDLLLFAWNRSRGPSLDIVGDAAVADAWAGLAS